MKRVADLLVDTLVAAGVERIYGLAGDSLNGITDSIRPRDNIKWVPVRHEETAAFAAGAEAHLTGRLAVCAGSCGPGNLHLINGRYDAHRSRVPVLAIAAQDERFDQRPSCLNAFCSIGRTSCAVSAFKPKIPADSASAGKCGFFSSTAKSRKPPAFISSSTKSRESIARNFRCRQQSPSNKPPASGCSCSKR